MTLYELYRYTPKEIIEIEYLLEQAKRFNLLDEVQEAFFQFPPMLVEEKIEGFGEHEPWAISHKRIIISELIYHFIDKTTKNEFEKEYLENKQINEEAFTPFVLKTDMRELDIHEIYEKFKKHIANYSKNLNSSKRKEQN